MRRGCLVATVVIVGLCIGGWVLLWYAGLPRLRGGIQEGLAEGIGTEIATRFSATPSAAGGGSYVVTAAELEQALGGGTAGDGPGGGVEGLDVDISPTGFALGVRTAGGQAATYRGVPAAADGRLVVREMRGDSDLLEVFLPAADLAAAIEDGVNRSLAAEGLILEAVELRAGEIALRTTAAN